jgi:hypothetical protein
MSVICNGSGIMLVREGGGETSCDGCESCQPTTLEGMLAKYRRLKPKLTPEERYVQRFNWALGEAMIRRRERKNDGRGWWVEGTVDLTADEEEEVRRLVYQVMRDRYPDGVCP